MFLRKRVEYPLGFKALNKIEQVWNYSLKFYIVILLV